MSRIIGMLITIPWLSIMVLFSAELKAQITSWSSTTVLPAARQEAGAVVWSGWVYVTGGDADGQNTGTNTVYRAQILSNGRLSSWTTTTMPVHREAHGCVVHNGFIYVLGGNSDWGNPTNTVRYALINPDGSLGAWNTTTSLPANRSDLSAVVWNGRIYATGGTSYITGQASLYVSSVIASDGTISSWTTYSLPEGIMDHVALAYNGYLYIIGGSNASWETVNTVHYARINPDGTLGGWATTTPLPAARERHGAFIDPQFSTIYVIGGYDGSTRATVWYARINQDGSLGNWTSTTSLPSATKDIVVCNDPTNYWAYVIGGSNASDAVVNSVLYTTDPPLPVQLTSFNAVVNKQSIELRWTTATEINNYGFEVERRLITDNKLQTTEWQKVGFVKGAGNSYSPKEYHFIDNKLPAGRYAYRLKQIDLDGNFKYSQSIEVDISSPRKFALHQNHPNPFNATTTIQYELPTQSYVRIVVYDILGQIVQELINNEQQAGYHSVVWNANVSSGLYFYRIEATGVENPDLRFVDMKKLILLK